MADFAVEVHRPSVERDGYGCRVWIYSNIVIWNILTVISPNPFPDRVIDVDSFLFLLHEHGIPVLKLEVELVRSVFDRRAVSRTEFTPRADMFLMADSHNK